MPDISKEEFAKRASSIFSVGAQYARPVTAPLGDIALDDERVYKIITAVKGSKYAPSENRLCTVYLQKTHAPGNDDAGVVDRVRERLFYSVALNTKHGMWEPEHITNLKLGHLTAVLGTIKGIIGVHSDQTNHNPQKKTCTRRFFIEIDPAADLQTLSEAMAAKKDDIRLTLRRAENANDLCLKEEVIAQEKRNEPPQAARKPNLHINSKLQVIDTAGGNLTPGIMPSVRGR